GQAAGLEVAAAAESEGPPAEAVTEPLEEQEPVPALLEETPRREDLPPPPAVEIAPEHARGIVRGIVRDAATLEPLPAYLLRFADAAGRTDDATSDDLGHFATRSALDAGRLRVAARDRPDRSAAPILLESELVIEDGGPRELDLRAP